MYLGIDLGTSGVKTLLIDGSQRIVGSASASLTVSNLHHGWSEQAPVDWIAATEEALTALSNSHSTEVSAITGIGLSGQQHGATLLDAENNVLRPCILWNDTRSHVEAAALNANEVVAAKLGNVIFPGYTAPKLMWCRKHEPEIFAKVARVLLPKDYLRWWFTGEFVSDMSDASGTGWLDIADREWSDEMLSFTDMSRDQMPSLVEGTEVSGQLRHELAARWGISGKAVVAGGGGDNAASACGLGTIEPGSAFASLGTSGVLFVSNESFKPNIESAVHAFCHALPGVWHQMGVILSATDSLNWYAGLVGDSAVNLTSALGSELQAPSSTTFLPYLSGERTPHNDAHIRGVLSGLTTSTSRQEITRSILDGVSFAFRDNLHALRQAGTDIARVTAVGGGSQSAYWLKSLATALDRPVDILSAGEFGAAFGAARLGMIAAENADPMEICKSAPVATTIEPVSELREVYNDAYERFRAHYPAMKPLSLKG
ncbi:xylulokinase [Chromatiales bacterium (ex Bugula neritina AB1)]|nr:xylulokinase [Chromatiales bacterium (ex Bugula neritina AB1)]